jgi:regulatory protein
MRTVRDLQRTGNGFYRVTIAGDDGVTAPFRLSEDLVVELRLLPGKILDEAAYGRLMAGLDADRLYATALAHLSRAARTAAEMRTFLKAKCEDPALVDRVYSRLLGAGLIDDRAFALGYFDYHFDVRREGPRKIAFDLDRKGIFADYVAEAIGGATAEKVLRNLAWLFDRKLPALAGTPREKAIRTMKAHLIRRGYDPGIVLSYCDGRRDVFPEGEAERRRAAEDLRRAKRRLEGKTEDRRVLRQKLMMALKNRGYSYETIRRTMEEMENDE